MNISELVVNKLGDKTNIVIILFLLAFGLAGYANAEKLATANFLQDLLLPQHIRLPICFQLKNIVSRIMPDNIKV